MATDAENVLAYLKGKDPATVKGILDRIAAEVGEQQQDQAQSLASRSPDDLKAELKRLEQLPGWQRSQVQYDKTLRALRSAEQAAQQQQQAPVSPDPKRQERENRYLEVKGAIEKWHSENDGLPHYQRRVSDFGKLVEEQKRLLREIQEG